MEVKLDHTTIDELMRGIEAVGVDNDRLRAALQYVHDHHHEGDGEFDDIVKAALKQKP